MTYDNNMRGTLGKNERREKETHPEYTGKCEINGQMYWISAWVKEGQGRKFFSLAFKPQDAQARQPAPRQAAAAPQDEFSDDVPFASSAFVHDTESSKERRMRRYGF